MKYLLDTNICIYIINQKPKQVFERFYQYQQGDIGISSITACELTFGVEKSNSQRNKLALEQFLSPLEILPFSEKSIWHYARVRQYLQSQGKTIGSLDMLIASHALTESITLVTNNTKEFERVPDLLLENWV